MPEIRECFMHYKHTHNVLVEHLQLGTDDKKCWALRGLWADATEDESGMPKGKNAGGQKKPQAPGLTDLHSKGYLDRITANCTITRGQQFHQTKVWPPSLKSENSSVEHASQVLETLVLEGISWTPRSLIFKFRGLDLQVSSGCSFIHHRGNFYSSSLNKWGRFLGSHIHHPSFLSH